MFAYILSSWLVEAEKKSEKQQNRGVGGLARRLRKNGSYERRKEETSLLKLEAQSHRPHPAADGLPRGRLGLPDTRGAERVPGGG